MKIILKLFIILVFITFVVGCGLLGPSEEDIAAAVEASMRGVQSSMKKENMEVKDSYTNAADLAFVNKDETVVHEMSFTVNEDKSAVIVGVCSLAGYEDTASDYLINGTFSYDLAYPDISNSRKVYGEFNCEMEYTGGKIDTLEFYFNMNKQGQIEEIYVNANGREIDYEKQKKVHNFFKYLDPSFLK